jgi:hypothetical protein
MTHPPSTAFPGTDIVAQEVVEVRTLDDLVYADGLQAEVLVKLDVQGYEDKVIGGAQQVLRRAQAAIVEVSFVELYAGQRLFAEIHGMLKDMRFDYFGSLYQVVSPVDGRILQADALFLKR